MVSQALRGRVAAPLLALAVSAAAGAIGSAVTRPAPAMALLPVSSSTTTMQSATTVPPTVAGWVDGMHNGVITVRSVSGMELTVVLTPATQYSVYRVTETASRDVLAYGAFAVVTGHVEYWDHRVTAVSIMLIPHFRGARPGFEGHRDGLAQ